MRHGFHQRQRPRLNFHAARANRFADRVRLARRIDERERSAKLFQPVDVRIRHERLSNTSRPIDRQAVEVIEL
jgi:hypothetical protein